MAESPIMSAKYPRTYHMPFSPGCKRDDKRLSDVSRFLNVSAVASEKLDGSNADMESAGVYARSHSDFAGTVADLTVVLKNRKYILIKCGLGGRESGRSCQNRGKQISGHEVLR